LTRRGGAADAGKVINQALRTIGLPAAAALMTLLAALCLAAAVASVALVGGPLSLPVAVLAAAATFQGLRVPVGRAASWLIDG
jgi:spore maturation protein SpmB